MKNLLIILGILASIFLILLIYLIINTDFSQIPALYDKISSNLNQQINKHKNLNSDEFSDDSEEINEFEESDEFEYIGDLNFYSLELGRSEADIQSKRTYTFYLPVDITYELQGVDASSSILLFKKDGQEIFKLTNFDYAKSEDDIDEFWPEADEYSLVGGHTNILELLDDDYEDDMYIFADTLKIDEESAF